MRKFCWPFESQNGVYNQCHEYPVIIILISLDVILWILSATDKVVLGSVEFRRRNWMDMSAVGCFHSLCGVPGRKSQLSHKAWSNLRLHTHEKLNFNFCFWYVSVDYLWHYVNGVSCYINLRPSMFRVVSLASLYSVRVITLESFEVWYVTMCI